MKSAGEEFIIKTKYQNMGVADQMKGAPRPAYNCLIQTGKSFHYRPGIKYKYLKKYNFYYQCETEHQKLQTRTY